MADFAAEFERYKRKKLNLISLETVEGDDLAKLYGVTQYPAILVMSETGSLVRLWQGNPMPLMDELSYYVQDEQQPVSRFGHIMIPAPA